MAKIKKRGLDYFPMDTDFIHNRLIQRIMKREGDAAVVVLVEVLSYIYGGEGYYIYVDDLFYEDISADLYEKTAADVKRIILLAVKYGIFDTALFREKQVLTSADIQSQYLFSTKRRRGSLIEAKYCVLPNAKKTMVGASPKTGTSTKKENESEGFSSSVEKQLLNNDDVTFRPENVTLGTHSIAQHSIA
jgi:hypothetical protein